MLLLLMQCSKHTLTIGSTGVYSLEIGLRSHKTKAHFNIKSLNKHLGLWKKEETR